MPNNLVFSNVASQMQVQMYGQSGTNVLAVQTDTSGNLQVVGTVTAVVTSGTITALLDTVTAVVTSGTITALLDTVTAVVASGTITALLDTVTALTMPVFTETSTTVAVTANTTITAITADTSLQKVYSFYVANTSGVDTLTAILQISPVDTESFYLTEPTGETAIAPSSKSVLVAQKYLKFTRLLLTAGTNAVTAEVSYNAQS